MTIETYWIKFLEHRFYQNYAYEINNFENSKNLIIPYPLKMLNNSHLGLLIRDKIAYECCLSIIPYDILLYITQFLKLKNIIYMANTCRSMYCFMTSNAVLKHFWEEIGKIITFQTETNKFSHRFSIYKSICFVINKKKQESIEKKTESIY